MRLITPASFSLCALTMFSLAFADPYVRQNSSSKTETMSIEFSGTKSGESVWTVNQDGTFSGSATIQISTIKLESKISGKRTGGIVTSFEASSKGPQGNAEFSYKPGSLEIRSAKGKQTLKYDMKTDKAVLLGNLIPQLYTEALSRVKFESKTKQSVTILIAEAGVQAPFVFLPKGTKVTPKGTAKMYGVTIGAVEAELAADADGRIVGMDVPAQKLRWIVDGWSAVFEDPLAKFPELSQATYATKTMTGLKMKTRDGVELVSDVILPSKPGKYPVILTRTPYGRASDIANDQWYAQRGYAVVSQDCRGRGASGGNWDPFVNERKDGYDAIDWIAKQDWCDGNVGMIGGSYGGYVQWAAAVERHPALKCIIPQVSPPDAMRNLPYEYGTFMLYGSLWWARIVQGKDADMSVMKSPMPHPEKLSTLPLSKVDDLAMGKNVPFFDLWLKRYRKSDWKGWDFPDDIARVEIPVLHISGWWDGDGIGTKLNWEALRSAGKKNQWLIYGPWVHAFNTNSSFGGVDYGKKAIIDLDSVFLRWFDTWLKNKPADWEHQPKVRAFVTGANQWLDLADWPDANVSQTKRLYFFAPSGAIAPKSYGLLVNEPPLVQKPVVFTYDPKTDTVDKTFLKDVVQESTTKVSFEGNRANIVFQTPALSAPMRVGGPITVSLSFSTSAKDTDFFAILADTDEKGVTRIVGQPGKVRASYIADMSNPQPLTPNKKYKATLRLWDTAHEFAVGHKLSVLLTSSMFPAMSRNLGTAEPPFGATRMVKQVNSIYLSKANPSYIEFAEYKQN